MTSHWVWVCCLVDYAADQFDSFGHDLMVGLITQEFHQRTTNSYGSCAITRHIIWVNQQKADFPPRPGKTLSTPSPIRASAERNLIEYLATKRIFEVIIRTILIHGRDNRHPFNRLAGLVRNEPSIGVPRPDGWSPRGGPSVLFSDPQALRGEHSPPCEPRCSARVHPNKGKRLADALAGWSWHYETSDQHS